jgi:dihydrolipoamide dehydrogenase
MSKELQKVLKKLNFDFKLSHKVVSIESKGDEVLVKAENNKGETIEISGDYCLVSIGRRPYTEGLGLENVGITPEKNGTITVNEHLQTKVSNIYAIGDVIRGAMLAHKAEEEGVFVAEHMMGQKPHINYLLIPGVIYTWPEVASVGYSEEQLKEKGTKYKTGTFPFKASGRARASMDNDGLVKVLAVVAMEFRASAEDIARMSHAHPTFSEAFKEACLAATDNRALHI